MKIRIVEVMHDNSWYFNMVGEILTVIGKPSDYGYLVDYEGSERYVAAYDCEEVIEHNSQLYRKVDRPVREGDTVLITKLEGEEMNRIFTVERLSTFPGDFRINEFINGDNYVEAGVDKFTVIELIEQPVQPSAPSYAEVSELLHEATADFNEGLDELTEKYDNTLRNLADVVEHNGKQYRKVKRKAAVGELVVVEFDGTERFKDGEIVKPFKIGAGGIIYVKHPQGKNNGGAALYIDEYHVLEQIESPPTLTETDLIANLAQEVAELKRELSEHKATVAHRGRTLEINVSELKDDIADLENRLDENEKDTEEVIELAVDNQTEILELDATVDEITARINDLGDGAEAAAVVPTVAFNKLISNLEALEEEKLKKRDDNQYKYPSAALTYHAEARGIELAIYLIKEALRNG